MKTTVINLLIQFVIVIFISNNSLFFCQSYSTFSFTSSNILDGPSQWGAYGCFANGNLINSNCLAIGLPSYFTDSYPIFSAQTTEGISATSVQDITHQFGNSKFLTFAYSQSDSLPFYKVVIYFNESLPANFGGFDIINKSTDNLSKTFKIEGYKNNVLVATQFENIEYNIPMSVSTTDANFSDIDRIEIKAPGTSDMYFFGVNNFLLADHSALSLDLISFNAEQINNSIEIKWSTISEYNSDYFVIEKSNDNYNWNDIAKIDGAGNYQGKINYSFIDEVVNEEVIYYRLIHVDFNGNNTIYDAISVKYLFNKKTLNIYPNPAKEHINMNVYSIRKQNCNITICSSEGKNIKVIEVVLKSGLNQLFLDTNDFKPGIYFVKTSLNPEDTIKIVIQ